MAAADMSAWRKQNSDAIKIELFLTDGSRRTGTILKSRDKTLREVFNNGHELFLEFECDQFGTSIVSKSALLEIRQFDVKRSNDADVVAGFQKSTAGSDRMDPHVLLGVEPGSDKDAIHSAYIKRARAYHPDRFAETDLPGEVRSYIDAMARRVNAAYVELSAKKDLT